MNSLSVKKTTHKDVERLIGGLVISELFLLLIYLCSAYAGDPSWHIQVLFDMDAEANIPTWFSSIQLLGIGLVFLFASRLRSFEIFTDKLLFKLCGLAFIYLSMDEVASIHEKITLFLRKFDFIPRFTGDHGIWILFYFLIGAIITSIFYMNFVRLYQRYKREMNIIFIGFAVLVFGGVGIEILGYLFLNDSYASSWWLTEASLEEFFEMLGETIILYGAMLLLPIYEKNHAV